MQAIYDKMDYIRNRPYYARTNGAEEKRLDMIGFQTQLTDYMKHFVPDATALEIIKLGTAYKIMGINIGT